MLYSLKLQILICSWQLIKKTETQSYECYSLKSWKLQNFIKIEEIWLNLMKLKNNLFVVAVIL